MIWDINPNWMLRKNAIRQANAHNVDPTISKLEWSWKRIISDVYQCYRKNKINISVNKISKNGVQVLLTSSDDTAYHAQSWITKAHTKETLAMTVKTLRKLSQRKMARRRDGDNSRSCWINRTLSTRYESVQYTDRKLLTPIVWKNVLSQQT